MPSNPTDISGNLEEIFKMVDEFTVQLVMKTTTKQLPENPLLHKSLSTINLENFHNETITLEIVLEFFTRLVGLPEVRGLSSYIEDIIRSLKKVGMSLSQNSFPNPQTQISSLTHFSQPSLSPQSLGSNASLKENNICYKKIVAEVMVSGKLATDLINLRKQLTTDYKIMNEEITSTVDDVPADNLHILKEYNDLYNLTKEFLVASTAFDEVNGFLFPYSFIQSYLTPLHNCMNANQDIYNKNIGYQYLANIELIMVSLDLLFEAEYIQHLTEFSKTSEFQKTAAIVCKFSALFKLDSENAKETITFLSDPNLVASTAETILDAALEDAVKNLTLG